MNDASQLADQLGQLLQNARAMVTTAESCTGGGVSQAITGIAGSAQWFSHGFITYSNRAKTQLLGVAPEVIDTHGAVSQPVVEAMVSGAAQAACAEYAIAISGVAGPDGGSLDKPVGTVWIAWKLPDEALSSEKFLFPGDRESVRNQAVIKSLHTLINKIQNNTV